MRRRARRDREVAEAEQREVAVVEPAQKLGVLGGLVPGHRQGLLLEPGGDVAQRRAHRRPVCHRGADVAEDALHRLGELFEQVQPEDFLKYGLIPEFIGRLPVVATLDELDERALIKILTEPRNALTKQYEKLLSFEKVKLKFTEGALGAVARKAFTQKTGARGLRAILEEVMLDVMYDAPSQKQIKEVFITEDAILGKHPPIRIFEQDKDIKTA